MTPRKDFNDFVPTDMVFVITRKMKLIERHVSGMSFE